MLPLFSDFQQVKVKSGSDLRRLACIQGGNYAKGGKITLCLTETCHTNFPFFSLSKLKWKKRLEMVTHSLMGGPWNARKCGWLLKVLTEHSLYCSVLQLLVRVMQDKWVTPPSHSKIEEETSKFWTDEVDVRKKKKKKVKLPFVPEWIQSIPKGD